MILLERRMISYRIALFEDVILKLHKSLVLNKNKRCKNWPSGRFICNFIVEKQIVMSKIETLDQIGSTDAYAPMNRVSDLMSFHLRLP